MQPGAHQESTALVLTPSTALAATSSDFGEEHKRIVRDAFCPGASQEEFDVLWAGARSRRLDPIRRQIHFVSRKDDGQTKWTSQVSIDGFRAIAQDTGLYDGQDEAEYEIHAESGGVMEARVRVYRKDINRPFVGVARWEEFAQLKSSGDPMRMWAKMPRHMLAKCAEALALRKAFPEQLAGLYTHDEMGSAEPAEPPPPAAPRAPAPPAFAPADMLKLISATAAATEVDALLKHPAMTSWPKVRAIAWMRILDLSEAWDVDAVRARYRLDISDPALLAKLDAARTTTSEPSEPAREPGSEG